MKKVKNVLIGLAMVLVMGISVFTYNHYNAVSANESQKGKNLVDAENVELEPMKDYATAEFFLVKMMRPQIDEIVREKFGKDASWTWNNLEGLYFYETLNKGTTTNKNKDWFEVTVNINISSEKSKDPQGESVSLKVIPPKVGENISDTEIEFIRN